jgi:uncharacterized protein YacL
MIRFVRIFGAAMAAVTASVLYATAGVPTADPSTAGGVLLLAVWIAAWTVIGYSILPYLTVQPAQWLIRHVLVITTAEFVSGVVGLLVGLLIALLLALPMSNLPHPYGWLLPIGTAIVLGLGMMGLTIAKRHDLAESLRGSGLLPRLPVPESADRPDPITYLDTSAIIDGRITDVVAAGFLWGTLVAPRFVIDELQSIADHRDAVRRGRGRRGLEVLAVLQKDPRVAVDLSTEDVPELDRADAKLVELARRRKAGVLTNDYNLNRVAQLHEVRVLNLNQLANAIKPVFLPGDGLHVRVVQQGKEPGQGLAYLEDGTMVVVEGGGSMIERELDVTVVRVLQTVAGRMVFAQPRAESHAES